MVVGRGFGEIEFYIIVEAGAAPVEPPAAPVGQNAEANLAARRRLDRAEVAPQLRRRTTAVVLGAVERSAPALALNDGETVGIGRARLGRGVHLGGAVGVKEVIGHVGTARRVRAELATAITPPEQIE